MLCSKCNYDNPADAQFCMKCGTKVENRCSSCNTVNPADANFCRKCGGAIVAGSTRAFSANSLRNETGNFKGRTGKLFRPIRELSGSSREPVRSHTLQSPARFLPKLRQSCGHRKDRSSVVQVHSDGRCTPRDCRCARR